MTRPCHRCSSGRGQEALERLFVRFYQRVSEACDRQCRVSPYYRPGRYRNAAWCDYLASLGGDDAIVARYTALQNTMLEHCRSLEAIVQSTFTEIGTDWEDDQYVAVADDLKCRFLTP